MSDLKPHVCPRCDFGSGFRGMDRCGRCGGTGSVFYVGATAYPNTEDGFNRAMAAKSSSPAT